MSRHRKPPALPPDEPSAQLRVRLRCFALATSNDATGAATMPFPEHVTVLAGTLRRNRRLRRDGMLPGLKAAGPQKKEEQDMTDTSFHGALLWPLPAELQCGSNSRYFIDTEYTDFRHCQLVSLAIVGENGDEFYGERIDFDLARCSDFVRKVVLPQLGQLDRKSTRLNSSHI